MAPLEPWEKVLVDVEAYAEDEHSKLACTNCHGGEPAPDKETAHTDIVRDPSSEICHLLYLP